MDNHSPTIAEVVAEYLDIKNTARGENTTRTYGVAIKKFCDVLRDNDVNPDEDEIGTLKDEFVSTFIRALTENAAATERLYLSAVVELYKYIEAEELKPVNMAKIRSYIKYRARKYPKRLPSFPVVAVDRLLDHAWKLIDAPAEDDNDRLRNLRDRALIISLADTGLRIHEACCLNRGDVERNTRQALVTGKGKKDAVVRFSIRSAQAIDDYLKERTRLLDGREGKALASLPLFAQHAKKSGKKIKRITTRTGQNIVERRAQECLPEADVLLISPHTLRHYFVTRVVSETGNLKLAQKLARHENIAITQLYAHLNDKELNEGYRNIFDRE